MAFRHEPLILVLAAMLALGFAGDSFARVGGGSSFDMLEKSIEPLAQKIRLRRATGAANRHKEIVPARMIKSTSHASVARLVFDSLR